MTAKERRKEGEQTKWENETRGPHKSRRRMNGVRRRSTRRVMEQAEREGGRHGKMLEVVFAEGARSE